MDPLLSDAALAYAAAGFPIFPLHSVRDGLCTCGNPACKRVAKHPRTRNGLKDATTALEVVRGWWQSWPDANIGVRTGDGLVVLDVDVKHGALGKQTMLAVAQAFKTTFDLAPRVVTPTLGEHFWFRGEARSGQGVIGPGVDVRGEGGYVVAPPSIGIGAYDEQKRPLFESARPYEWVRPYDGALPSLPEGLVPQNSPSRGLMQTTEPQTLGDIADGGYNYDKGARERIPHGQHRTAVLKFAWHLRAVQGLAVEAALPIVRAYADDAAILEGLNPADPFTDADLRRMLAGEPAKIGTAEAPPEQALEGIVSDEEIADEDVRPLVWLIPDFLPLGELGLIYGAGSVGKSSWVGWLAARASSLSIRVGFVGVEEPFARFSARARLGGAKPGFLFAPARAPINLRLRAHLAEIERFIREKGLGVLYFDSIRSHFTSGREDAATAVRGELGPLADLAQRTNCLILGTFHENKSNEYSGSTEMLNVPRVVLHASSKKDGVLWIKVKKANFRKPKTTMVFERQELPYVGVGGEIMMQTYLYPDKPAERVAQTLAVWEQVESVSADATVLSAEATNAVEDEREAEIRALLREDPNRSAKSILEELGGNAQRMYATIKRLREGLTIAAA